MSYVKALHCRECQREYPERAMNVCEFCFGPLEITYDYAAMRRDVSRESIERGPLSMWRYKPFLPVGGERIVDINAGFTPLIRARNLGDELGLTNLWVKNDCVNPTYSFKDRVVSVAATKAVEFGFTVLACASTGNLAGSVAAHAARAGLKAFIFVPSDLEQGKILGASIYAPTLVAVSGNYDEVNRLCSEVADKYEWAFVNINVRPYYSEGSKTLGYEVAEQLGWRAPDAVVVPIASGSMFTKIWKGLNEFAGLGLIDGVQTRMFGAQADGCSPVAAAYRAGSMNIRPVRPNTIAKSLAIGNPADGYYALKVMQASGGGAESVSDPEIVEGIKLLARTEGIFGETAAGVVVGNLRKLVAAGRIERDELVVAYITGNGLKTTEAIADALDAPLHVAPTMTSFEAALQERQVLIPA
jgi:threonine synthase